MQCLDPMCHLQREPLVVRLALLIGAFLLQHLSSSKVVMRRQDLTQLCLQAHKHLSCQNLATIDCFHLKLVSRSCCQGSNHRSWALDRHSCNPGGCCYWGSIVCTLHPTLRIILTFTLARSSNIRRYSRPFAAPTT